MYDLLQFNLIITHLTTMQILIQQAHVMAPKLIILLYVYSK